MLVRSGLRWLGRQGVRCFGEVPAWVETLREAQAADMNTSVNYDIRIDDELFFESKRFQFDPKIFADIGVAEKAAFCAGNTDKEYVCIGDAFSFPDWEDNPVVNSPEHPAKLWWDPAVKTEKVMVQLGPHVPPGLWIPIRPTHDAVKRLFSDFTTVDAVMMERYLPVYEKAQSEYEEKANTKLTDSAGMRATDHFKDGLRFGDISEVRKDHPLRATFFCGTASHPVDVERRVLSDPPNPFVFSWPILMASHDKNSTPAFTAFRSVYSKSIVVFEIRMDCAPDPNEPEGLSAAAEAPVVAHVYYPDMPRMSGGKQTVARMNSGLNADFPVDIPVDVPAALWKFNPKSPTQLQQRLERMIAALPAQLGRTVEERRQASELATTVTALAATRAAGFADATAPLRTRPEPQLRLAVAAGLAITQQRALLDEMIAAETNENVLAGIRAHTARMGPYSGPFDLTEHTKDTASTIVNPAFNAMSPDEATLH